MASGAIGAAAAGADMLRDVLRDKLTEAFQRRQLDQDQQRIGLEQQRNLEMQRSREAQQAQVVENSKYLNEQRIAATADRQAATADRAAKQAVVDSMMNDPNVPAATRLWLRAGQAGLNQASVHDFEAPEVHTAHLTADADRKRLEAVNQHSAIRDYDVAHPLPTRIVGAKVPGADDPALPLGAQRYIVQIAAKHAGNPAAASAELAAYMDSPETQAAHPRLAPVKAMTALHQALGAAAAGRSGGRPAGGPPVSVFGGAAPGQSAAPATGPMGAAMPQPGAATAAAAGPKNIAAAPKGSDPRIGRAVTVQGKQYTVKAINSDGTADLEPIGGGR